MSRSPLLHPLFWGALGLLLVNDHLLKGAGVLPGWLTGKLSDVAGLVVAPVLLCALFGARRRPARALCFGLVTAGFAAVNTVPALARALDGAMTAVGVPWRSWSDPTDLVALAVLPAAWWVSGGGEATALRGHRLVERTAMVMASLACIATSYPVESSFRTASYLVNRTDREITVRVRWTENRIDCDNIGDRVAEALAPSTFGAGTTFALPPGQVLPLERGGASTTPPEDGSGPGPAPNDRCEAVLLQIDGLADRIVFWEDLPILSVPASTADATVDGGVDIDVDHGDLTLLARTDGIQVAEALARTEPTSCAAGYATAFEWSEVPFTTPSRHTVIGWQARPDGCVSMSLKTEEGDEWRMFLCVPAAEIPFAEGDLITIDEHDAGDRRLVMTRSDEFGFPETELHVFSGATRLSAAGIDGTLVPLDCEGERAECGAFTVSAGVTLQTDDGLTPLAADEPALPGQTVELTAPDGRPARVTVGQAAQVVVGNPSCSGGTDELGPRMDAVVVIGE